MASERDVGRYYNEGSAMPANSAAGQRGMPEAGWEKDRSFLGTGMVLLTVSSRNEVDPSAVMSGAASRRLT
jgi:hypothetical protein